MAGAFSILDLAHESDRSQFESRLRQLCATTSVVGDTASAVAEIIEDVRVRGDEAVVQYMRKWTDPAFQASSLRVTEAEFDAAEAALEPALRESLTAAIANVRRYQDPYLCRRPSPR